MFKVAYNGLYRDQWLENVPARTHKSTFLDMHDLQHSGRDISVTGNVPREFVKLKETGNL